MDEPCAYIYIYMCMAYIWIYLCMCMYMDGCLSDRKGRVLYLRCAYTARRRRASPEMPSGSIAPARMRYHHPPNHGASCWPTCSGRLVTVIFSAQELRALFDELDADGAQGVSLAR
jgi:hypothetical protein